MDEDRASAAIIAAGRRLGARGLISAGEGNLSIRLDADRLLVTPTGRRKDELGTDELVVVRIGHAERRCCFVPLQHEPRYGCRFHAHGRVAI